MQHKLVRCSITFVMAVLFIIITLYTSIELVAYDDDFYRAQYTENQTAEITGFSVAQLMKITHEIQAFLKGDRESFDIRIEKGGHELTLFRSNEIQHMDDVQQLFTLGRRLRLGAAVLLALIFLLVARHHLRGALRLLGWSALTAIVILGLAGVAFAIDFNGMFVLFHQLAFTNELWYLDPRLSLLINLVPEAFFSACIFRIVFFTGGMLLVVGLLGFLLGKKLQNK